MSAFEIAHVITPTTRDMNLENEVHAFFESEMASISPSLRKNYSAERLDIGEHLIYSVLKIDGAIKAAAGIYNGGRYPPGVFRILNRSYISPDQRLNGSLYECFLSRYILAPQIELCRDHFKYIFVSREGLTGKHFLRFWKQRCAPSDFDWQLSSNLVHVSPRGQGRGCYQYMCFADLEHGVWNPRSINETEWLERKND